jgi:hypothetical protein
MVVQATQVVHTLMKDTYTLTLAEQDIDDNRQAFLTSVPRDQLLGTVQYKK